MGNPLIRLGNGTSLIRFAELLAISTFFSFLLLGLTWLLFFIMGILLRGKGFVLGCFQQIL